MHKYKPKKYMIRVYLLYLHVKDKSWVIGEYITRVSTKHSEHQSCQSKHHTQFNPDSSVEALIPPKFKNQEHPPNLTTSSVNKTNHHQ